MKERDHQRETAVAELDRALAEAVLTGREERSVTALRGQDALTIQGVTQLLWAVRLAEATQLTTGHRSPVGDLCSPDPGVPVPMPPGTEVERCGQVPPETAPIARRSAGRWAAGCGTCASGTT